MALQELKNLKLHQLPGLEVVAGVLKQFFSCLVSETHCVIGLEDRCGAD